MGTGMRNKKCDSRSYKLRGTLLVVDLVNSRIAIQPYEKEGQRVRWLQVTQDSEILAGDQQQTLADVIAGDWVHARFLVGEQGENLLEVLFVPRPMTAVRASNIDGECPIAS